MAESDQLASEDLRGQTQSLGLGEAHVVQGLAAAPAAVGVLRALFFRRHVAASGDLVVLTHPDPVCRAAARAGEG